MSDVTPIRPGVAETTAADAPTKITLPDVFARILNEHQATLFDVQSMLYCIERTVRHSIGFDGLHVTEESLLSIARAVSGVAQLVEKVASDIEDVTIEERAELMLQAEAISAGGC